MFRNALEKWSWLSYPTDAPTSATGIFVFFSSSDALYIRYFRWGNRGQQRSEQKEAQWKQPLYGTSLRFYDFSFSHSLGHKWCRRPLCRHFTCENKKGSSCICFRCDRQNNSTVIACHNRTGRHCRSRLCNHRIAWRASLQVLVLTPLLSWLQGYEDHAGSADKARIVRSHLHETLCFCAAWLFWFCVINPFYIALM